MSTIINLFNIAMTSLSTMIVYHWYLFHNSRIPKWLLSLYAYGKTMTEYRDRNNNSQKVKKDYAIQEPPHNLLKKVLPVLLKPIPKSSFRYFYDFAIIVNTGLIFWIPIVSFLGLDCLIKPVFWILFSLPAEQWNDIKNLTAGSSIFWIMFSLVLLQVSRRCYETHLISVFSPQSMMTVSQALFGFGYYLAVSLAVLRIRVDSAHNEQSLNPMNVSGILIFTLGFLLQYNSSVILASLRRRVRPSDNKELVVTYDHMIPYGGLFSLVSCPHYTAEIVIYFGLFLVSSFDSCFGVILFNVICNHLMMSELSHKWYRETFREYPKERRMLIPFVL